MRSVAFGLANFIELKRQPVRPPVTMAKTGNLPTVEVYQILADTPKPARSTDGITIHQIEPVFTPLFVGGHKRDLRHLVGKDRWHKGNRDYFRSLKVQRRYQPTLRDHRINALHGITEARMIALAIAAIRLGVRHV